MAIKRCKFCEREIYNDNLVCANCTDGIIEFDTKNTGSSLFHTMCTESGYDILSFRPVDIPVCEECRKD